MYICLGVKDIELASLMHTQFKLPTEALYNFKRLNIIIRKKRIIEFNQFLVMVKNYSCVGR